MFSFVSESRRLNLFWLRIMEEHALFLRLGLPCEEINLRQETIELENAFRHLLNEAKEANTVPKTRRVNEAASELTTRTITLVSEILQRLITCEDTVGFNLYPLLIDHIRRETIYYRAALVRLQQGINVPPTEQLLIDEGFWLRIMGDHSRFIAHLLDPSERSFVEQAREFAKEFDDLRLHTVDFTSMLVPRAFEEALFPVGTHLPISPCVGKEFGPVMPVPSLLRFTKEAIQTTAELRDFKRTARDLISDCRILSNIPVLLVDHLFREAGRAVDELQMALRNLPGPKLPPA